MDKNTSFRGGLIAAAVLGLISSAVAPLQSHAEGVRKVRWLLAHQPADAFRRAAKTFNEELKKQTNGQMELVVLEPKDVGSKTENMNPREIFRLLAAGEVELSQTVAWGIGQIQPKFYVLDMPFLFQSHEHASRVLEGKVGKELLASLEKNKVHGLAFTYSGGFRVIPSSDRAIRSVDDFKGMRVRSSISPVAAATFRAVGATPVQMHVDEAHTALANGNVDAAETTYIRVSSVFGDNSKFLNETEHSLFLTSILASSKFYGSLTDAEKTALQNAAVAAARIEREDSVNDGKRVRADFEKRGVPVVRMSEAESKKFRERMKTVYEKFEPMFGKKLIDEIKSEAKN